MFPAHMRRQARGFNQRPAPVVCIPSLQMEGTSKRQRTSGPAAAETQIAVMDSPSTVLEFKVDYEQTKHLAVDIDRFVHSDAISAAGHMWRINYLPHGTKSMLELEVLLHNLDVVEDVYPAVFVELLSKSRAVKAMLECFLIDKSGEPLVNFGVQGPRKVHVFRTGGECFGWNLCRKQRELAKHCVRDDGKFTLLFSIVVLEDDSSIIPVPPSDIKKHLGDLLDTTAGTDVSFNVDGQTFHAHRAVLAARSPVFRAELLGSMAEATMPSITLEGIAPATFKAMLRFMYTDSLAADDELGGDTASDSKMMQDLLAAADRYLLDRLKLICAQKLWDFVSVGSVADTLACAEMYNCPVLKNSCMDFFAKEENFKKAVLTRGFLQLGVQFPSIIDDLRERVGLPASAM